MIILFIPILPDHLITSLKTEFPLFDMGPPIGYLFLGISVTRTSSYMILSQMKYAQECWSMHA